MADDLIHETAETPMDATPPESVDDVPTSPVLNDDRARLVDELCPDGEAAMESQIAEVLAQDIGLAAVGRMDLAGGSVNGCTVPRLIRVRLDGGDDSRLAEPTPRAVVEAGLSLLRALEAE